MIGAVRALSKTTTTAQCLIPTKQNKNHMIICTRIINNAYTRTYANNIGTFFFLRIVRLIMLCLSCFSFDVQLSVRRLKFSCLDASSELIMETDEEETEILYDILLL